MPRWGSSAADRPQADMVGPSAVVLAIAFATGAAGYAVPSVRVGRSASGSPTRSAVVRLQGEPAAADLQDLAPEGEIISSNTYGLMLTTLLKTNESIAGQISANYGLIDYAFLQRLDEAVAEGKPDMKERLEPVLSGFGYSLLSALIVDIKPHRFVQESMNDFLKFSRV